MTRACGCYRRPLFRSLVCSLLAGEVSGIHDVRRGVGGAVRVGGHVEHVVLVVGEERNESGPRTLAQLAEHHPLSDDGEYRHHQQNEAGNQTKRHNERQYVGRQRVNVVRLDSSPCAHVAQPKTFLILADHKVPVSASSRS